MPRRTSVFAGKVTCGVRSETSGQSWPSNTLATGPLTDLSSQVVHPVSCRVENSTFDLVYKVCKNNFTCHLSAQNFSDLIPAHSGLVLTRAVTDYFFGHCLKRVA